MPLRSPLILDLDGGVLPLPQAQTLALPQWHDPLRFACSDATLDRFAAEVLAPLPAQLGTVMLGSGDFHHLSLPLLRRMRGQAPFQLVVLDNHPDNMRFPLGMHCGSWVNAASKLPQISHIHVLGITSSDIGLGHAWENHWRPLMGGRLTYWCMDVDVGWGHRVGIGHAFGDSSIPRRWSPRSPPSRPRPRSRPTCRSTRMYSPRTLRAATGTRAASSWNTHWW